MDRAFHADLQARRTQIEKLATQIHHLRARAVSTTFPAERDSAMRVADQQTIKMDRLQTELAHLQRTGGLRTNPLPPLALAGLWACAAAAMAGGVYLIATSFKTKINEPAPLPNFTPQGPVTVLV